MVSQAALGEPALVELVETTQTLVELVASPESVKGTSRNRHSCAYLWSSELRYNVLKNLKNLNPEDAVDIATISANGQITLPVDLRRRLQLGAGDKVVFVENEHGDNVVVRPAAAALLEAQRALREQQAADGFENEDDLDAIIALATDAGRLPRSR